MIEVTVNMEEVTIGDCLDRAEVLYDFDISVPCYYVMPRFRLVLPDDEIEGVYDTRPEAEEVQREEGGRICYDAIEISHCEGEPRFKMVEAASEEDILSADVGDGRTLELLIKRIIEIDNPEQFAAWARQNAVAYTQDPTLIIL